MTERNRNFYFAAYVVRERDVDLLAQVRLAVLGQHLHQICLDADLGVT